MRCKSLFILSLIGFGMMLSSCFVLTSNSSTEKNYDKRKSGSEELTSKAQKDDSAVDMGLSVKWASYNLSDEDGFVPLSQDVGGYYAWGEIETKPKYTWDTYKWRKGPVFNYRESRLKKEDDVAFRKLGRGWRLPTYEEFKELIENCNIKQKEIKKVRGLLFTSKINGNSIFLPFTNSRNTNTALLYSSFYWCSNGAGNGRPWCFAPTSTGLLMSPSIEFKSIDAQKGCSIRPVYDEIAYNDVCQDMEDNSFKNFCLNAYDMNRDGRLSLEEASQVTKMDIRRNGITSLLGIEFFVNLTSLDCGNNKLTNLDVSKNSKLVELSCYNNQLTSLDVNRNTKLEKLDCRYNELTNLDVNRNTKLEKLDCSYNKLTNLDVSKNSELVELSCNKNQLRSLNVSGNTALKNLNCEDNQITSIDVSRNSELVELSCNKNQLRSLNVSGNTALKNLNCEDNQITSIDVSRNSELVELSCYNNQLRSLDVSRNIKLKKLYCNDNQLTSLDVSRNTKLESLNCDDNQLKSLDVSRNTALDWLWCNNNQITSLDVSNNTELTTLCCDNNQIADVDVSKNYKLKNLSKKPRKTALEVWVSDTGSIKFYLYTDGTADVFALGVGRDSKWEKKNGKIYVRGFGSTQAYVINPDGELYSMDSSGRLVRVKNSTSSPFGSDGVIMHKK